MPAPTPADATSPNPPPVTKSEWVVGLTFLAAMIGLRVVYAHHFQVDSDETQHLHVVWAWVQGRLPYRDVFDHHAPLFQMLCAPVLALVGERADVVVPMRLAMIPLALISLTCVFRLGRALYGVRTGLWAAVFAGLLPPFFFCSTEFRPDDLWVAFWLLTLVVLSEGKMRHGRSFAAGLTLGAAVGVSLKSTLLLLALGGAGAVTLACAPRPRPPLRACATWFLAGLAGLLVVPLALTFFFAAHGALAQFYDGTIQHNLTPGLGAGNYPPWRRWLFPTALPFLLGAAWRLQRGTDPAIGARRSVIALAAGFYATAFLSYWPLLPRESYLPFEPLLALQITPLILALATCARTPLLVLAIPTLIAGAELKWLLSRAPIRRDHTVHARDLIAATLVLTAPGDFVFDMKGETVFRERAFFYALEPVSLRRIGLGLVADTIGERLVATRTAFAVIGGHLPPRGAKFLAANYLPVGAFHAAGFFLPVNSGATECEFNVRVPARYTIVSPDGPAAGSLDGTEFSGPRELAAGPHHFAPQTPSPQLALIWANAVEHGLSPFLPQKIKRSH